MKTNTLFYSQKNGWADSFSQDRDAPNTAGIVFGTTSFLENTKPLPELAKRFPHSKLIGCSTAGEIPGQTVNDDCLVGAAAALMTDEKIANEVLSIAISCVGRRLILGERAGKELEAVMDYLPPTAKQIGFYPDGEISPYSAGHGDLHNQMMTLTTISEK